MWRKHYWLVLVSIGLVACSPRESLTDARSNVLFVPLDGVRKSDGHPDRVVAGMSRQEVEALMGPSVETCWMYREGNVEQRICFRDRKVNVISRTEHEPGTNRARIDATFAAEGPTSRAVPTDRLAIGASTEQVSRLLGPPRVTEEQYDVGGGYRAAFVNGRLTELRDIPAPPAP